MTSLSSSFGIVGGGWRTGFYLRIAHDFPGRFPLAGVVVRDPQKRDCLAAAWSVPVFATVDELLAQASPSFVVTSVAASANPSVIDELVHRGVAVLSETPVAQTLPELCRMAALVESGARIQVAEQYLFQPSHAAALSFIRSGRLGAVREADVSSAHGYHGISLLRHYLDSGLRLPAISARRFESRIVAGPGRGGNPREEKLVSSNRVIAQLDYGDRLGIYDFTGDQYFSWIRSPRRLIRGERGEINQDAVRWLQDFQTPLCDEFRRRDTGHGGNLEGHALSGISVAGEIIYQNPFPGARWSDDEIAVATSLAKMQDYIATGQSFYSVAEACQDRYLDLLISEALETGQTIQAVAQPWHSEL